LIQWKDKKDGAAMGTGGRWMERREILHQLIHFFLPQQEVPSDGRMASQSDQNGMNGLLPLPLLF
jgi:hypothetical protein